MDLSFFLILRFIYLYQKEILLVAKIAFFSLHNLIFFCPRAIRYINVKILNSGIKTNVRK